MEPRSISGHPLAGENIGNHWLRSNRSMDGHLRQRFRNELPWFRPRPQRMAGHHQKDESRGSFESLGFYYPSRAPRGINQKSFGTRRILKRFRSEEHTSELQSHS